MMKMNGPRSILLMSAVFFVLAAVTTIPTISASEPAESPMVAMEVHHSNDAEHGTTWDDFFHALHMVEASGRDNPPDGDGGNAIGPFQIWEAYWTDAVEYDTTLVAHGETYQSCRDINYARRVVRAYMNRYCTERRLGHPPTWEMRARFHNGGCNIHRRQGSDAWNATTEYWAKLNKHL